jgi:hypothetical protein
VSIRSKFVAILLLVGLLAAPAAALSACWRTGDGGQHDCPSGCPMMAKMMQVPADSIQARPENPNCCQISSGKPAPASPLVVPNGSVRVTPPAVRVVPITVTTAVVRQSETATPPLTAPSQPVLCTFLI